MEGLIVAMDMLDKHCGTKKYKKRIFVITDGEKKAKFDVQEKKNVIKNMNKTETRLNVITLDFCDDLAEDENDEEKEQQEERKSKRIDKETNEQHANKEFLIELT